MFRKYLWLIPISPFVILLRAIGLVLMGMGRVLELVAEGFRWVFEKATGQKTYRRQQRYSRYYYRKTETEIDDPTGT